MQDTGIGIPKDRLDRLFKSFSQVDTSTTRKYGGTSVLASVICQATPVELMGGQIGIDSIEGKGTTFWFTLKLGAVAATDDQNNADSSQPRRKRDAAAESAALMESLKGVHLLVAEDNEMNQFVTRETLNLAGCTCDIVGDGSSGRRAVRAAGNYDAILMDCQMPVMDGPEAARRIREPSRRPILR